MRIFSSFVLFSLLFLGNMPVQVAQAAAIPASPGDLIRGTTFSAVYYMGEDGFRYVFPNVKTYTTWYANEDGSPDFSSVRMLSDADLATIQMGGNVTYRPGSRMVKIASDAKTYFVESGGELRWVTDEAVAEALYGDDWNQNIHDVPDAFFGNYTVGTSLTLQILEDSAAGLELYADRILEGTSSISDDKELTEYATVTIDNMQFQDLVAWDSTITINAGETVRFENEDNTKHTATADDGSWGTGTLNPGDAFVKRFSEAGTYTFYCGYHESMTGTIVVE